MKLFTIHLTNNLTAYGGVQILRQTVLFIFLGTPTTYTYDSANNITSKTVNGTSKNYTYDDNNLLDTYGTYSFTYDKMGNPTKYKGNTFVWKQGRKLASGTMNGKSFTYTYDPNGMRYKKVVNGVTTNYYYNGTQLLMEDRGSGMDRIYYIYGANGISGMIVQEGYAQYTYYFDKNVLGDIIAIRNDYGNVVARYSYDAWGNHTVYNANGSKDNSQSSIGNINPFRYRGYYYDTETGFYYLQTRYYDPTICRFINADDYELVADLASSMQLNMYAYCGNNPVMCIDPTGCFWDYIFDAIFLVWGIHDVIQNPNDWTNWVALGIDVIFAVVPFVTTGGGKVVKLGNLADDVTDFSKVTVIGETMSRVQTVSQFVNAADNLYEGFTHYNRLSSLGKGGKFLAEIGGKGSNVIWLYKKARKGYTIIDIGIDIKRATRSSSYITEKIFLSIWKTRNIWKFYQVF